MKRLILGLMISLMASPAWSAQWNKDVPAPTDQRVNFPTDQQANNDSIDRLLANYREGMSLSYSSATTVSVSAGEVVASNSDGSVRLMLQNAAATSVTFSNIDTESEASSKTYYIYAGTSTSSDTSATFYVSLSSTAPTGVTYYKRLGSFYNNSSSDIDRTTISNDNTTNSIRDIRDFSTSTSSYTIKTIGDLKICFGHIVTSSGDNGTATITNLPYSTADSYVVLANLDTSNVSADGAISTGNQSASSVKIINQGNGTATGVTWMAIGY